MFPDDGVVTDLDEVVDFGAFADDGFAEACAVDGGVCADLDIIADDDDADLVDLEVAAVYELIAVAV